MKNLSILACSFLTASTLVSRAELSFYDSFNYTPVGNQLSSAGAPSWGLLGGVTGEDPRIGAGSLTYPNLQTATGDNSVVFNGGGLTATGVSVRVLDRVYNSSIAPSLYYSLTLRVNTITAGDWGGSGNWNTGSFMLGFNQKTTGAFQTGDSAAPLLIRTGDPSNTSGIANDFQGFQLGTGVTQTSPGSRVFDGTRVYNPGDTLFVVVSYTFGPGSNDDVARLWVNPTPGSLEGANTPVVNATGVPDVNNNQISAFYLRNNSVEPSSLSIDDLRVGTTWADVTPVVVPEPATTAALAAFGLAGFVAIRRFRR